MSPSTSFSTSGLASQKSKPIGISWRCHYWYTTAVIGFGITTDIFLYSLLIPTLPFRLSKLGYHSVPALVGYMLFAYASDNGVMISDSGGLLTSLKSAGLVICTPLIAWHSERFSSRWAPLILGLILQIGCQLMLMFAPSYGLMVLGRVLQGFASSIVWTVGLALVCDMTPPERAGRQFGFVLSGFSTGFLLGPTVGGALYDAFGWNGPLILGIIFISIDLFARLLIIDRDEALKYGMDPRATGPSTQALSDEKRDIEANGSKQGLGLVKPCEKSADENSTAVVPQQLSLLSVVVQMGKSTKALTPLACALINGIVLSMGETTVPLRLRDVWAFNSTKIGLIYLGSAIPPLFGSPLEGWLSDKWGTEWVLPFSMLLSIPWWCILIIKKSLALFIAALILQLFFTNSAFPPIMAELAAASDKINGVGYAHVYGAFNLVYGVGFTVGPIIGSQIYQHSANGWLIICIVGITTMLMAVILTGCFSGNTPWLTRFKRTLAKRHSVRS